MKGGKISRVWKDIAIYDIIVLVETHILKKQQVDLMKRITSITNDYVWAQEAAIKKYKKGRGKGGILVGVRKSLGKEIEISTWPNGAVISGIKLSGGNKCRIVAGYNNVGIEKILFDIRGKIEDGREKGEAILVMGDYNARIGELQAGDNEEMYQRRSRDKEVKREGEKTHRIL